jgi:putative DNA primase/helicase
MMQTLIPDPEMRAFLQRAVGYSLLGDPSQRAMFILHGPKRTGKSQLLNVLSALFGDYGDTAMAGAFHRVDQRGDAASPGLHALRSKRFVAASEESERAVLDTESLKRLTGNEAVSTRALYQGSQRWRPQMVLWIATNSLPQLNSDDDAIWDRVKPISFTTKFSARGGEGTIKETPGIAESIFAEEASGIFNWALAGLKAFQEAGGLDEPERVAEGVADYRHETDPVSQFWSQMKETGQASEDSASQLEFRLLYEAYAQWCTQSREQAMQSRRFARRIRSITGVTEFIKSNSRYYVPGWKWVPVHGYFGTFGGPGT